MNNAVLFDVMPCGTCKNRRFGGTYRLHHHGKEKHRTRNNVSNNQNLKAAALFESLVTANVVPSLTTDEMIFLRSRVSVPSYC
jgi:hypothetical protein